ncbi:MAG TPA: response regulator transcription factor [Nitrospiria bacterium]|jgi:DNA-binding NarL/FixJ family response regulator|nr:response regulator transcription factor [Nitrospiria bacterium]
MTKARVILADDHKIVIEGLKSLLEPEFDIVGTVQDGRELINSAQKLSPDVIVVDISMPGLNGIEAVQFLKHTQENVKVVFLTMHPDVAYAVKAFESGASGYVLKHSAPEELITAIRESLKGRTYVTPLIAGELMQSYKAGSHRDRDTLNQLTSRQRQVLQLLAEGHSAKEIATILDISVRTVEFHKYRMMEDLGINNGADLIRYAIKHRVVSI